VGIPLPLADARILDADDQGTGEIAARGPNITQGYFRNEAETGELFDDQGYLRTGDVGYADRQGYICLTGRKKSLMVTEGGKNVCPEDIEEHFQLFRQIEQIMITGCIRDAAARSEGIEALVLPSSEYFAEVDGHAVEEEIRRLVRQVNAGLLPCQRISRTTVLEEPLEITPTHKIKRGKVLEGLKRS